MTKEIGGENNPDEQPKNTSNDDYGWEHVLSEDPSDPFGYYNDYLGALSDPSLDEFDTERPLSEDAKNAAQFLAVSEGKLLINGISMREYSKCVMEDRVAAVAAETLSKRCVEISDFVKKTEEEISELGDRYKKEEKALVDVKINPKNNFEDFDDVDEFENNFAVADIIEALNDIWGAVEVIRKSFQEYTTHGDCSREFKDAFTRLEIEFEILNANAQKESINLSSMLQDNNLINNLRNSLAPKYRNNPPWWLSENFQNEYKKLGAFNRASLGK